MATDNAVAALGRVLSHHPEALGPDGGAAYAQLWLGSLPLKADAVEATAMHEQLVGAGPGGREGGAEREGGCGVVCMRGQGVARGESQC